jgi:hypothetical protein
VIATMPLRLPGIAHHRRAIRPRVMRPKATHPRATRRVMRLLRSAMCRRPQARHLRAIHSRHTIRRPTPIAEATVQGLPALMAAPRLFRLITSAPRDTPVQVLHGTPQFVTLGGAGGWE